MCRASVLRLVLIGAPGSGKGTIASRLVKTFGVTHCSSGDIIRAQVARGTLLGAQAAMFVQKGSLVPDDIVVGLVAKELQERGRGRSWLLDGFPRTLEQAEVLAQMVSLTHVLHLNVPFRVITERIAQRWIHAPSGRVYNLAYSPPQSPGRDDVTGEELVQRADDTPRAVRSRLEEFTSLTTPLLEYYRSKGILATFSGSESDVIWPQVEEYLHLQLQSVPGPDQTAS